MLDYNQRQYQVIAVLTNGRGDFEFGRLKGYPPFASDEQRLKFLDMANAIPGMNIPPDKISGYPSFPLNILNDEEAFVQFIRLLDNFIARIQGM
jgi:hypothetical protein